MGMGKASDLEQRWAERDAERHAAIARGERPPGYHPRPELHLRADTPSIDVHEATQVGDVLRHVTPTEYGVALREPGGEVHAMLVPLDRYIELASGAIAGNKLFDLRPGVPGSDVPRIVARPSALEAMHVEQIDPNAEWHSGGGTPTQRLHHSPGD